MKLESIAAIAIIAIFGSLSIIPIVTVAMPDIVTTFIALTKSAIAAATVIVVLSVLIITTVRIMKGN